MVWPIFQFEHDSKNALVVTVVQRTSVESPSKPAFSRHRNQDGMVLRQDAELNPDAYNHAQVRIVYSLQTPCRNLLLQMYSMLLSTIHTSTVNGTATMARHAVYVVGAHSDVDGDLVVIRRPPPSRSSSIVRVGPHIRVALYVPCVYLPSNPTVTIGSNRRTLCRILVRGSSFDDAPTP